MRWWFEWLGCGSQMEQPEEKRSFFEFSYVCPEPVLVKCSFVYINGSKRPHLHWGHRDYPAGGKTRKRRIGSILSCENDDGLTLPRHAQDQLKQKLEENAVPFFRGPNRTAVWGRSRAATAGAGPSQCSRTSAGNVSSFAVSFIAFVPSLSWQAIVFHKEMEGKPATVSHHV